MRCDGEPVRPGAGTTRANVVGVIARKAEWDRLADTIRASGQHERLHQQAGQKTAPDPIVKNVKSPLAPREPSTEDIASSREGLIYLNDRKIVLLFVTLEKVDANSEHPYNDWFDGDTFHWDSQNQQNIDSPRIRQMVLGTLEPQLFVRVRAKIRGETQPFVFAGRLEYIDHNLETSNPVHIRWRSWTSTITQIKISQIFMLGCLDLRPSATSEKMLPPGQQSADRHTTPILLLAKRPNCTRWTSPRLGIEALGSRFAPHT